MAAYADVMTSICLPAAACKWRSKPSYPKSGNPHFTPLRAALNLLACRYYSAFSSRVLAYQAAMCYSCTSSANSVYSMRTVRLQFGIIALWKSSRTISLVPPDSTAMRS